MIKEKNHFFPILDQIQQDNTDAREGINKYVATISNEEEDVSLEQVFYILLFDAVFISNK